MIGKKILLRLTSVTLVAAMLSLTLTSCYVNKETVQKTGSVNNGVVFESTELEEKSKEMLLAYEQFVDEDSNVKKAALKLKEVVQDYMESFDTYNAEIRETIKNISKETDKRQKDFEIQTKEKSLELIKTLNTVIEAPDKNLIEKYNKAVDVVEDFFVNDSIDTTSADIVPNAVEAKAPKTEKVDKIDSYKNNVKSVNSISASDSSLKLTDETQMTEEMKTLADKLKTPLKVYQYIKNNVNYENYYGSRKGAIATFESNAGNDVDQASLLIAMLRYLNYPAQYVRGSIVIDNQQAIELTSSDTVKNAANVLAASGKPVTTLITGGEISGIRMEQTWVQTYVPYTDYRGAGNADGDKMWIALDPSIKSYTRVEGIYDKMDELGITQSSYDNAVLQGTVDEFIKNIESLENSGVNFENLALNTRCIVEENLGYLPLSLQYTVEELKESYDAVPTNKADRIQFKVNGQVIAEKKSLELYGKRLIIEYAPATDSDKQVIEKYGSIFDVPSYLVNMVPQLKLDGEVIGAGPAITLGSDQSFTMTVNSNSDRIATTNKITAGSIYQITEDMQSITEKELTKASKTAESVSSSINVDNVYSDEYLGKMLDLIGKMYFAQVDVTNQVLAEKMNISFTRTLSAGMTGYSVESSYMFGMPVGINEGRLYIDVDLNTISAVSRTGDREKAKEYVMATGVASSKYESLIWEEFTGEEAVSSISILDCAKSEGQRMMVLSKANYSSEKQNLRMSSDVLSSIETAINAGKIVSTHTDEVTMGTWKGYGYIITDPSTGAAAYMISGGLSGGSSSGVVTLAYLVDIGFAIADIVDALRMIPTMLSFFSMGGPIGIAIGVVMAAFITATIIFAVMDYIESIKLMVAYQNGDMEAGEQLKNNMWINVGTTAFMGVLGAAGKAAVKTVAGKKVAKELGEEIAEKLLKNCDDPTAITKALKNLDNANVPKDTIKDIAESAGQEGLEWFGKQAKNGIKGDVLEKVFKNASDYTKYTDDILKKINSVDNYADNVIKCINNCGDDAIKVITDSSDELFERIAKSNGYADDIISCVKNYGDDAANAIVKHGDDAAIVISICGGDAAEVVANASDELFERIMKSEGFAEDIISCVKKYGDDAANAIVKCGDDAVLIISEYGENAAKAISKYGDEAVDVIYDYADDGLKALDNGITPTNINNLSDSGLKPNEFETYGITDNTTASSVEKAVNAEFPDSGNYGSAKTWKEFYSANNYTSAIDASKDYLDLVENTSPWPKDYIPETMSLKKGDIVYMVVTQDQFAPDTQKIKYLGNFASNVDIPDMNFFRNDLAVKENWKPSTNKFYVLELKITDDAVVKYGPVGPQIDVNSDKTINQYLSGNDSITQYEFERGQLLDVSTLVNFTELN